MHGYLTDKADIYSFGVVALEVVSGRSNTSSQKTEECFNLLDWVINSIFQLWSYPYLNICLWRWKMDYESVSVVCNSSHALLMVAKECYGYQLLKPAQWIIMLLITICHFKLIQFFLLCWSTLNFHVKSFFGLKKILFLEIWRSSVLVFMFLCLTFILPEVSLAPNKSFDRYGIWQLLSNYKVFRTMSWLEYSYTFNWGITFFTFI